MNPELPRAIYELYLLSISFIYKKINKINILYIE